MTHDELCSPKAFNPPNNAILAVLHNSSHHLKATISKLIGAIFDGFEISPDFPFDPIFTPPLLVYINLYGQVYKSSTSIYDLQKRRSSLESINRCTVNKQHGIKDQDTTIILS